MTVIPSPAAITRRAARRGRVLVAIALGLSGLVVAQPSTASVERWAYAEHVDLAGAAWVTQTGDTSTTVEFRVFDLDQRTDERIGGLGAVLFATIRDVDPATGLVTETDYEGFSGGQGASFDFDRSLSSATAVVPLTLFGFVCTEDEGGGPAGTGRTCEDLAPVPVEARVDWVGVGDADRDATNGSSSEPPEFVFGSHTVQAIRDARAVGTIAGPDLQLIDGTATFAALLRGRYHEQLVAPSAGP